jgi:hypothetical protein
MPHSSASASNHALVAMTTIRWRRLDLRGHEEARFAPVPDGWRVDGVVHVEDPGARSELRYAIVCDGEWRTRLAEIDGQVGARIVRLRLTADGTGDWKQDGAGFPQLAGALDVDFGFTPATNTLPIRRLSLEIGESRAVRAVWVRFPEWRVSALEQTYTRVAERIYRYEAFVDGEPFSARLETDGFGLVRRYEGLWDALP